MEGSRVVERAGSSGETITFNTLFRASTFDETECCNPASILLVLTHQIPTRHEICHAVIYRLFSTQHFRAAWLVSLCKLRADMN